MLFLLLGTSFSRLFLRLVLPYLSSLSSNVTSSEGPSLTFLCKVAPFFTFCHKTIVFFFSYRCHPLK